MIFASRGTSFNAIGFQTLSLLILRCSFSTDTGHLTLSGVYMDSLYFMGCSSFVLVNHPPSPDPTQENSWTFRSSMMAFYYVYVSWYIKKLTQCSSFILCKWTRIVVHTGMACESSVLTWLSCLQIFLIGSRFFFVNFHIIYYYLILWNGSPPCFHLSKCVKVDSNITLLVSKKEVNFVWLASYTISL